MKSQHMQRAEKATRQALHPVEAAKAKREKPLGDAPSPAKARKARRRGV